MEPTKPFFEAENFGGMSDTFLEKEALLQTATLSNISVLPG